MKARARLEAFVDWVGRWPKLVVLAGVVLTLVFGVYARGIELRSDLVELLPRDSPGFRAYEHQAGRAGGSSMLIVVVASPDRAKNEAFIDLLGERLVRFQREHPDLVTNVEASTRDIRAYYEANKWLYADLDELESIDADLDHQIAIRSGLVEDLAAEQPPAERTPVIAAAGPNETKKSALGLDDALARWKRRAIANDAFPSGYFSARGGTLVGLRILSSASLGGALGDRLLEDVRRIASELRADARFDGIDVGYTGDVASAAGEKKALVDEAAYATALAVAVILIAIVVYFRSFVALLVIMLPVAIGVSAAYAFARFAFGYVNSAGAFLGAIIVGNGINYPIVLFARYREFRASRMPAEDARRTAVVNALRAELVGACVASVAYGSLALTQFRGFRQFGLIGFVGMLLVWVSIVPIVPALIVLLDRWTARGAPWTPGILVRCAARVVTSRPRWLIAFGLFLAVAAIAPIPRWIGDPWEYDFGKLGSRKSDISGAGEWSNKANEVFGGKANIAGAVMIADRPEQVPLIKAQILDNDAHDPKGRMIAEVTTIDDVLPGSPALQRAKLAVLDRIRERLSPRVLASVSDEERTTIEEARPPEALHVLAPTDLPGLLLRRFVERKGTIGTVFYVKPRNDVVFADGHNHLRLSRTTDNVRLPDGTVVKTASRSTIFAEMLASLRHDGPRATGFSLVAVTFVVLVFSRSRRVAASVLVALSLGVVILLGVAAATNTRLNYVNFIALPITFGIGCEYPFNLADRVRLLDGDVGQAIRRSAGAVLLCSFTTTVGYGSLLFSDFQALQSFGKLAVIGEVACVFAALVVMPALLVRRENSSVDVTCQP